MQMLLLLAQLAQAAGAAPASAALSVRVAPGEVLVERARSDGTGDRYLNFDFLVSNGSPVEAELQAVRVSGHDASGTLLFRRFCDRSGISPCIGTVPDRTLAPGATGIIYNPFHTLPGDLPLATLSYELAYQVGESGADTLRITVTPRERRQQTALVLPLAGRSIVFDGHDFHAHHRRWNLAHPIIRAVGFDGNSGRYAYDLSLVDGAGRMYRGTGDRNSDWLSWEAPVRAPAAGTVVASANDEPDWEVGRTSLSDSTVMARPVSLFGNYVILDHGNGEFSLLAHLRQGSVPVRAGHRVRGGETIGKIGFSGSVYTIHLHYQLQRGPRYADEGIPSVFRGVRRVGAPAPGAAPVRIDSGDIIESR